MWISTAQTPSRRKDDTVILHKGAFAPAVAESTFGGAEKLSMDPATRAWPERRMTEVGGVAQKNWDCLVPTLQRGNQLEATLGAQAARLQ